MPPDGETRHTWFNPRPGGVYTPDYQDRKTRTYLVSESELSAIGTMNLLATLLWSFATGFLFLALGIYVAVAQQGAAGDGAVIAVNSTLRVVALPLSVAAALILGALATVATFNRISQVAAIRRESKVALPDQLRTPSDN